MNYLKSFFVVITFATAARIAPAKNEVIFLGCFEDLYIYKVNE